MLLTACGPVEYLGRLLATEENSSQRVLVCFGTYASTTDLKGGIVCGVRRIFGCNTLSAPPTLGAASLRPSIGIEEILEIIGIL